MGKIPEKYSKIIELPGVGDYVASAFLSIHYEQCHPLIDINAVRLWRRVFDFEFGSEIRRKNRLENWLSKLLPTRIVEKLNWVYWISRVKFANQNHFIQFAL